MFECPERPLLNLLICSPVVEVLCLVVPLVLPSLLFLFFPVSRVSCSCPACSSPPAVVDPVALSSSHWGFSLWAFGSSCRPVCFQPFGISQDEAAGVSSSSCFSSSSGFESFLQILGASRDEDAGVSSSVCCCFPSFGFTSSFVCVFFLGFASAVASAGFPPR